MPLPAVHYADSPASPAREAYAVVPSDSLPLDPLPKAIVCGSTGQVTLRAIGSPADVSIAVQAGQLIPVRARYVRATGTTATDIVALA